MVKVTLVKSTNGEIKSVKATVAALGLTKIRQEKTFEETPAKHFETLLIQLMRADGKFMVVNRALPPVRRIRLDVDCEGKTGHT